MTSQTMKSKRRNKRSKQRGSTEPGAVSKYASDAWSLAQRTASGLNEIRKLINIETKFLDTVSAVAYGSQAGVVTPVTQVAQGLTSTTRVGDSIKLQTIEIRGTIHLVATTGSAFHRIILFRDLDNAGTAPVGSDVLEQTGTAQCVSSPYRFNTRQRFSILFDEVFSLNNNGEQGNSSDTFYYNTAHGGHVLYLGSTAATASNGKGSIYMLNLSDTATVSAASFYSRVTFTDD